MDTVEAFKGILYALADGAKFLFTTSTGIIILAALLTVGAVLKLWSALSAGRLMADAAGEDFGAGTAIGIALRELVGMGIKAAGALPALAGLAIVLVLLVGLADTTRELDEYIEGRKRIAELTTTVRNLDRDFKALEARIDDLSEGRIKATLSFFDKPGSAAPARVQAIDLPGKELYIDAIVCNFVYSEIAAGEKLNLWIPSKVFTDQVPEAEGLALSSTDENGIPLMFRLEKDELYGIAPDAFTARRGELMAILRSDEASRGEGIVRSVYGNAVHKAVKKGESFSVWVEQSGGMRIKEAGTF
jgi:hypothetical protein